MRIDLSKRLTKYAKNVLVIILVIQICILSSGVNVMAAGETIYPALIYDSDQRKENVDKVMEEIEIDEGVDSVSIEDCLAKIDDSKVDEYAYYLKEVIKAEYINNKDENSLSSAINYFACDTKTLNDVLYNMGNPSAGNPIPKSETFVNSNNKTNATIYNMKKAMWMLMQYVYYGEDVDNIDKSMLSNGYFQFSVEEGFGAEWYYVDSISGETYSKIWNTLANKGILEKTRQKLKNLYEDSDIALTYKYYKYFGFGEDSPEEEPIVGVTDEEWENQNQENKDDYLNFDSAEGEEGNNGNKKDPLLDFLDGIAGVLFIGWKIIPIIIGGAIDSIMDAANGQTVTIDTILFNEVDMTKINFFERDSGKNASTINAIRTNVSVWYISLRNLAAIILVLILIYVAIRMAISTVAEEKAKYKRMLTDWLTSLCILFILHYIIVLVINLNNSFVDVLRKAGTGQDIAAAKGILLDNAWGTISFIEGVGNAFAYMMLSGMTFIYFLAYLKRMITIAFLIIIAPLITITYSIDKMGDGKSQALNTWLKEFTYNILIQPFQCIIYLSIGSAALSLLSEDVNLLNAIIAIYLFIFMFQAEEIVKNIFGFKSQSMAKTIAGAAVTGAIIGQATSLFKGKDKDKKKDTGSEYKPRPKTKNAPDVSNNVEPNANASTPPTSAIQNNNGTATNTYNGNFREDLKKVDAAYSADGFGKNANGEYFNPWTDEYDKDYDPFNDPEYRKQVGLEPIQNTTTKQAGDPSEAPTTGESNNGPSEEDLYTFRRPVQPYQNVHTGGVKAMQQTPEKPKEKSKIAGYAKDAGKWLLRHNLTGGLKVAGAAFGLSTGDTKTGMAGLGLGSVQGKKIDDAFEKKRVKSNEKNRFSRIANSIDDFQGNMSNTEAMNKMSDYLDGISMPDRDDEAGLRLYQQLKEEIQIQKDLGKSDDEAREIVDNLITDSLSGAQSRI